MIKSVIWFLPKLSVTRSNWIKGLEEHLKERQHLVMSVGSWLHAAIVLKIMLICHVTFEPWKIEDNKNVCNTEAVISILLLNMLNQSCRSAFYSHIDSSILKSIVVCAETELHKKQPKANSSILEELN